MKLWEVCHDAEERMDVNRLEREHLDHERIPHLLPRLSLVAGLLNERANPARHHEETVELRVDPNP